MYLKVVRGPFLDDFMIRLETLVIFKLSDIVCYCHVVESFHSARGFPVSATLSGSDN